MRHRLEKLKIVPISIEQEIAGITSMYISLEDSCTMDLSKWPGVYHPESAKDVRADEADGDVAGDTDLDNRVMTSPERPHRPWLVPGAGRL
jgi:hypothetical protein